jgi:hypothetical protein
LCAAPSMKLSSSWQACVLLDWTCLLLQQEGPKSWLCIGAYTPNAVALQHTLL